MKTDTLDLFQVFKKTMSEDDARLVVRYMEDTNEAEIVRTVERKIEHLASKEDVAQLRAEMKSDASKQLRWIFLFWVSQLAAMFGLFYHFLRN